MDAPEKIQRMERDGAMNELKLDFDEIDAETLLKILEKRKFVWFFFQLRCKGVIVMKTKRGWHVYIKLWDDLPDLDVAFIQAVLGDDFKRACYNWSRVRTKTPNWNVLFTSNEKYDKDVTKRVKKMVMEWTKQVEDMLEKQKERGIEGGFK